MKKTWQVWRVHYATYQELADEGYVVSATEPLGKLPVVVARGLTCEQAIAKAEALGFGHSAQPDGKGLV